MHVVHVGDVLHPLVRVRVVVDEGLGLREHLPRPGSLVQLQQHAPARWRVIAILITRHDPAQRPDGGWIPVPPEPVLLLVFGSHHRHWLSGAPAHRLFPLRSHTLVLRAAPLDGQPPLPPAPLGGETRAMTQPRLGPLQHGWITSLAHHPPLRSTLQVLNVPPQQAWPTANGNYTGNALDGGRLRVCDGKCGNRRVDRVLKFIRRVRIKK